MFKAHDGQENKYIIFTLDVLLRNKEDTDITNPKPPIHLFI